MDKSRVFTKEDKRKYYTKEDKREILYKKIRINASKGLRGYEEGRVIKIEVDENYTPKEPYWRVRLLDSKIDNCVSFVEDEEKKNIPQEEFSLDEGEEIKDEEKGEI